MGFVCRNDAGKVIVTDSSDAMYFIRKGTLEATTAGQTNNNIGLSTATTYRFNLGATSSFPLVFVSCPTGLCAMLRVYASGGVYKAELLARGNSTTPQLYVFARKTAYTGTDKYGIKLSRANGGTAYDSRLGKILNLSTSKPANFLANSDPAPAIPNTFRAFYDDDVLNYDYLLERESLNLNKFNPIPIGATTKPAIAINTLAICHRSSNYRNYIEYYYFGERIAVQNIYYWAYAIYRGGFRIDSSTQVSLGWVEIGRASCRERV
jgi:hypothetical protein